MPGLRTLDHLALVPSGGLSADQALPWLIDIDVFEQAVSHVNWDTVVVDSAWLLNALKQSTGVVNAEIGFDAVMAAGTWTIEVMHYTAQDLGIYTVQLDGGTIGTFDGYSSGFGPNTLSSITGVVVSETGVKRLTLKMATKNASSGNYYGKIQHIQLRRTA